MEKEGKFNLFEGTVVEKENKKFVSSITMISDIIFEIIKIIRQNVSFYKSYFQRRENCRKSG